MIQAPVILLSLGLLVWSLNWTEVLEVPIDILWMLSLAGVGVVLMHIGISRSQRPAEQRQPESMKVGPGNAKRTSPGSRS